MTYRYIYKITCTTGSFKNKFYFGQHTTDNLDDEYKGSGVLLQKYYKKHPNDYIKEIISYHNSQEELDKVEYDIIHPFLNDPMCLNIADGGHGGFTGYHTEMFKIEQSKRKKEYYKNNSSWNKGIKMPDVFCNKVSVSKKNKQTWNKGKTGEYKWMTDGYNNYQLKPEYWGEFIDIGFNFGRTLNNFRSWNKGVKNCYSEDTLKKMSESKKQYYKMHEHPRGMKNKTPWNKK